MAFERGLNEEVPEDARKLRAILETMNNQPDAYKFHDSLNFEFVQGLNKVNDYINEKNGYSDDTPHLMKIGNYIVYDQAAHCYPLKSNPYYKQNKVSFEWQSAIRTDSNRPQWENWKWGVN